MSVSLLDKAKKGNIPFKYKEIKYTKEHAELAVE